MILKIDDARIVTFSVSTYQVLLAAYPASFRQDYGPHMAQVFRDCCVRAVGQRGKNGMARLWVKTFLDLVQSVISEHAHKEIQMKREMKPEDVRLAGSALMWGAAVFAVAMLLLALGGEKLWGLSMMLTNFLSMPLIVAGLLGLRSRYADRVGLGGTILLLGSILGPLTTLLGLIGLSFWIPALGFFIVISPALLLACLALFGVVALIKKPLPRWNAAPLIAGTGYPILTALYLVSIVRTGDVDGSSGPEIMSVTFGMIVLAVVQGVALAALGYLLRSDAPAETPAQMPPGITAS